MCSNVLNFCLVCESFSDISSRYLFDFDRGVLFDELINTHKLTSNSAEDLPSLLNLDVDALLAEEIHSFRLSEEHDSHLFTLRVLINKVR